MTTEQARAQSEVTQPQQQHQAQSPASGQAQSTPPGQRQNQEAGQGQSESLQQLVAQMTVARHKFHKGSKAWSGALYGCTVTVAAASATAGVLPKLGNSAAVENTAVLLGLVGAVLATITSQIRFAHKRAANRTARSAVDVLLVEVAHMGLSEYDAAARFTKVLREQSEAVTGPQDHDLLPSAQQDNGKDPSPATATSRHDGAAATTTTAGPNAAAADSDR